jgi:putative transposase
LLDLGRMGEKRCQGRGIGHQPTAGGRREFGPGSTVAGASRQIDVIEWTFYRWRNEYGGLGINQLKRLKQLESENARLKRAIADLTLDKQILKEAVEGNS